MKPPALPSQVMDLEASGGQDQQPSTSKVQKNIFRKSLQLRKLQVRKNNAAKKMPKKPAHTFSSKKRPSDETEVPGPSFTSGIPEKKLKSSENENISEPEDSATSGGGKNVEKCQSKPGVNRTKWGKNDGRNKSSRLGKPIPGILKKNVHPIMKRATLTAEGKPNWKILKKQAIVLKKERKEKEMSHFEIVREAKRIWELVRRDDCPPHKKAELITSLYSTTKDHLTKLVFAHDTSRIVQWLIKLGTPSIRKSICDILAPVLIEMLQKQFSTFCVKSLFKYGDKNVISSVIDLFRGNVMKLTSNSISAPLIESAYAQHASANQKKFMEQEFYGRSWSIAMGLEAKTLKEGLASSSEVKSSVLQDTKDNITRLINKENVTSSLLHTVVQQYLEVCSPEDKAEILALLYPYVLDLTGTKAGSRVAMQCCWYSSKKNKKAILKQLKGNVKKVCMMEEGHWVILSLLDAIDDTVLLNKIIVSPILNEVTEIVRNEYGRKVVLYLVAHRDTVYFHPMDIALLKQADNSPTVLKSMEVRRDEILFPVFKALLPSITSETSVWMQDASVAMVTLAVLKNASGEDLRNALVAVAHYICSEAKLEGLPLIEHSGLHLMLKRLLKVDSSREDSKDTFAYHLANIMDETTIKQWISCNRGCFILAGILETKKEEPINILLNKINEEINTRINEGANIGARILSKILIEIKSQSVTNLSN